MLSDSVGINVDIKGFGVTLVISWVSVRVVSLVCSVVVSAVAVLLVSVVDSCVIASRIYAHVRATFVAL